VDVRVHLPSLATLAEVRARSEQIHCELWGQAEAVARQNPDSTTTALFISSLNDTINLHTRRMIALTAARLPETILLGIYLVAFLAMALLGFQYSFHGERNEIAGRAGRSVLDTQVAHRRPQPPRPGAAQGESAGDDRPATATAKVNRRRCLRMKDDGFKTIAFGAGIAGGAALSGMCSPFGRGTCAGAQRMLRSSAMAGDELVGNPIHVTTRAVTIRAKPAEVWPWLVQMGYERGGMYSYDWVDRVMEILDRESTWQVMPECQQLEAGCVILMGSGPSWPVAELEPNRSMALHIQETGAHVSWSYLLEELEGERTRLVLPVRAWLAIKPQIIPLLVVMDPGEFLMV
jgi:hypothetical protein